jgi:hypothetical protein
MINKLLPAIAILMAISSFSQTTTQDGAWITDATWGGSSPGYTGINTPTVNHDVESASGLTFASANSKTLTVGTTGTLVVKGGVTFDINKNFAAVTVRSGGTLIIFGTLTMGKNNAGINVEAGGVLVVTGDVVDTGGGGNSINAVGDVYVGGSSSDVGGSGTVKPITELSDDGYTDVENYVNDIEAGGVDYPLPVELLYFNAISKNEVILKWATATEINNDYFSIERSEDGKFFYEIGRVKGNGNTNEIISYSYEDKFELASTEYYRLKQVDFDGRFEIFETQRIETSVNRNDPTFNIYPTIVQNQSFQIKSNSPFELKSLTIYTISGATVRDLTNEAQKQNHISNLVNSSSLDKGVYFVRMITTTGNEFATRIIIK